MMLPVRENGVEDAEQVSVETCGLQADGCED
jgi:hypothetical protein